MNGHTVFIHTIITNKSSNWPQSTHYTYLGHSIFLLWNILHEFYTVNDYSTHELELMIIVEDTERDESAVPWVFIQSEDCSHFLPFSPCVCVIVSPQHSSEYHSTAAGVTSANVSLEYLCLHYPWHWRSPGTSAEHQNEFIFVLCVYECVTYSVSLSEWVYLTTWCQTGLHDGLYRLFRYNPFLPPPCLCRPPPLNDSTPHVWVLRSCSSSTFIPHPHNTACSLHLLIHPCSCSHRNLTVKSWDLFLHNNGEQN